MAGMVKPTNIISEVLILDIFRADHVGEHDDAAGLPEAFPVFTSLGIFVEIDDLPHLRTRAKALSVILVFALTACHLLNSECVYNPTTIGAEALAFLMAPFGHEASGEALRIRSAKTHQDEPSRENKRAPTSCTVHLQAWEMRRTTAPASPQEAPTLVA